ncbi:hypothetical protein GF325_04870 [Candidatus Bathyarchaeota archaeon]|nr:hypothetical protein [Candidatus Bathyarchaeota archaeon]
MNNIRKSGKYTFILSLVTLLAGMLLHVAGRGMNIVIPAEEETWNESTGMEEINPAGIPGQISSQLNGLNASQFDTHEVSTFSGSTFNLGVNRENLTVGVPDEWTSSLLELNISEVFEGDELFDSYSLNGNFTGSNAPWAPATPGIYQWNPGKNSSDLYANFSHDVMDHAIIDVNGGTGGVLSDFYAGYRADIINFDKASANLEVGELFKPSTSVLPIDNDFQQDPGYAVLIDPYGTSRRSSVVSASWNPIFEGLEHSIDTSDSFFFRGDPSVAHQASFEIPFEPDLVSITFSWSVENLGYEADDDFLVTARINENFINGTKDINGTVYDDGAWFALEYDNETSKTASHGEIQRTYDITDLLGEYGYRKGWHFLDFGIWMASPNSGTDDVRVLFDSILVNASHDDWYSIAELEFEHLFSNIDGIEGDDRNLSLVAYLGDDTSVGASGLMRYFIDYTSRLNASNDWNDRETFSFNIPQTYTDAFEVGNFTFFIGVEYAGAVVGNTNNGSVYNKRLSIDSFKLDLDFQLGLPSDLGLELRLNDGSGWKEANSTNVIPVTKTGEEIVVEFSIPLGGDPSVNIEIIMGAYKVKTDNALAGYIIESMNSTIATWNITVNTTGSINQLDNLTLENVLLQSYNLTILNLPAHDNLGANSMDWEVHSLVSPLGFNATGQLLRASSIQDLQNVTIVQATSGEAGSLTAGTWQVHARQSNYMNETSLVLQGGTSEEQFFNGNGSEYVLSLREEPAGIGTYTTIIQDSSGIVSASFPRIHQVVGNFNGSWQVNDTGVGVYELYALWNDSSGINDITRLGWGVDTFEVWRSTVLAVLDPGFSITAGSKATFRVQYNDTSLNGDPIENATILGYRSDTGNLWGLDWPPNLYHADPLTFNPANGTYGLTLRTTVVPEGNYTIFIAVSKAYHVPVNSSPLWLDVQPVIYEINASLFSGAYNDSGNVYLGGGNRPYVNDSTTSIVEISLNNQTGGEPIREALITAKFFNASQVMFGIEKFALTLDQDDKGIYRITLNTTGLDFNPGSNETLEITYAKAGFSPGFFNISVEILPIPLLIEPGDIPDTYTGGTLAINSSLFSNMSGKLQPFGDADLTYEVKNASGIQLSGGLTSRIGNFYFTLVTLAGPDFLNAGEYQLEINGSATGCAFEGLGMVNFTILPKESTNITITLPTYVRVGNDFTVGVRLKNSIGAGIPNQNLQLIINYSAMTSFAVILETDTQGRTTQDLIIPTFYEGSNITVKAIFQGSTSLQSAQSQVEQEIVGKIPSNLSFTSLPSFVKVGYGTSFSASLQIQHGQAKDGKELTIFAFYNYNPSSPLSNMPFYVTDLITDQAGDVNFSLPVLVAGYDNLTVFAEYTGDQQIDGTIINTTLPIEPKWNSSISIVGMPGNIRLGQTIEFKVLLNSSDPGFNESLEGLGIEAFFNYGGFTNTTVTFSNDNGTATFKQVIPTTGTSTINLTIRFDGSQRIDESEVNQVIDILPKIAATIQFSVQDDLVLDAGEVTFSATLIDDFNQPVPGVELQFEVFDEKGSLVRNTTITTSSTGEASVSISITSAGRYFVRVKFNGADIFAGSISEQYSFEIITLATKILNLLPTILLLAALGVAVVFGLYKVVIVPRREQRSRELSEIYQQFSDAENIQYVIILTQTGLPIFSRAFSDVPIDESLVSGFLSAISSFGMEIGNKISRKKGIVKGLEQLSYGQFKIIVNDYENIRTAILLLTDASERLRTLAKDFNRIFYENYRSTLENWNGRALDEGPIIEIVERVFHVDLLYDQNIIQYKAQDYQKSSNLTKIERMVIQDGLESPFNSIFKVRDMINHLKVNGIDDVPSFFAIEKLRERGIIYSLSPKVQRVLRDHFDTINTIPYEAKLLLLGVYKGRINLLEGQELNKNKDLVNILIDQGCLYESLALTEKGRDLGYYFKIFLDVTTKR